MSSLNRQRLEAEQRKLSMKPRELCQDNSTRWNSTYYSLQRAVELREPLETILDEDMGLWQLACVKAAGNCTNPLAKPAHLEDYLSANDWTTVTELINILKPLEQATMRLQGHGSGSSYESSWQVIPVTEKLLAHFETIRENNKAYSLTAKENAENTPRTGPISASQRRGGRRRLTTTLAIKTPSATQESEASNEHLLCANVNLAWGKLDKYLHTYRPRTGLHHRRYSPPCLHMEMDQEEMDV